MTSRIAWKFRSCKALEYVSFCGESVSAKELLELIAKAKKLDMRSLELHIWDNEKKTTMDDLDKQYRRNSTVLIVRLPIGGLVTEKSIPAVSRSRQDILDEQKKMLEKVTNHNSNNIINEADLMAMSIQTTSEFQTDLFAPNKIPNPGYVCNKCNEPGHFISDCPNRNKTMPTRIPKAHGIPINEMLTVKDGNIQGAMMMGNGQYVVNKKDFSARLYGNVQSLANFGTKNYAVDDKRANLDVRPELLCHLCKNIMIDSMISPCCGISFCADCIMEQLMEKKVCSCGDSVTFDAAIPNEHLRGAVRNFSKEIQIPLAEIRLIIDQRLKSGQCFQSSAVVKSSPQQNVVKMERSLHDSNIDNTASSTNNNMSQESINVMSQTGYKIETINSVSRNFGYMNNFQQHPVIHPAYYQQHAAQQYMAMNAFPQLYHQNMLQQQRPMYNNTFYGNNFWKPDDHKNRRRKSTRSSSRSPDRKVADKRRRRHVDRGRSRERRETNRSRDRRPRRESVSISPPRLSNMSKATPPRKSNNRSNSKVDPPYKCTEIQRKKINIRLNRKNEHDVNINETAKKLRKELLDSMKKPKSKSKEVKSVKEIEVIVSTEKAIDAVYKRVDVKNLTFMRDIEPFCSPEREEEVAADWKKEIAIFTGNDKNDEVVKIKDSVVAEKVEEVSIKQDIIVSKESDFEVVKAKISHISEIDAIVEPDIELSPVKERDTTPVLPKESVHVFRPKTSRHSREHKSGHSSHSKKTEDVFIGKENNAVPNTKSHSFSKKRETPKKESTQSRSRSHVRQKHSSPSIRAKERKLSIFDRLGVKKSEPRKSRSERHKEPEKSSRKSTLKRLPSSVVCVKNTRKSPERADKKQLSSSRDSRKAKKYKSEKLSSSKRRPVRYDEEL